MAAKDAETPLARSLRLRAEAEARSLEARERQRKGMEGVFTKDIAGSGPQAEMRKLQTGAMKDISSGAAARRGAEAGLRTQLAGAGARPGGAAAKRGLIRAGEAGVIGAGAQVAGSAEKVVGMAGKVRGEDVGIGKADKTARMKFHQLRLGEELAREGMKAQVSAAAAGKSCFIAGTMVTMADGSKKKIEHVLVGEKVLGVFDKVNTVLDYNRPPTAGRSLYSINDGKAFITHEHPLYTLKGWKAINPLATFEELKPTEDLYPELLETTILEVGDEIVSVDGLVKVESIKEYEAEFFTQLYNFILDGDHTYFADGYLVHNGGKAAGGEMLKRLGGSYTHKNGKIKGAGTETSDSIKARLSDGEFVVNSRTVRGIGEALGAKGKHPSRQKGSAYLYAIQKRYGDKKNKDVKGMLPVKMQAGGMTGMDIAKYGSMIAKTGILGKGAKTAGDVVGAGVGAHEEGVKAKTAKTAAAKTEARAVKQEKAWDTVIAGKKPKEVSPSPEAVGIRETKSIMKKPAGQKQYDPRFAPEPEPEEKKVGGEVKFGKGVKVRKKFLDSIGHKPFKHFEDKAEKDYKEGATGYKNIKKRQSSSVPGFEPISMVVGTTIALAAAAAAKAEADRKKALRAAEAQEERQAGVEAGKGLATSAKGIMKQDTDLKDGGSVIDRPQRNVEKLSREPLGKEYRLPEHGEDIYVPPRKKLEPRATKKPPPWMRKKEKPEKFSIGKKVESALGMETRIQRQHKERLLKKAQQGKLNKEDLESAKQLGYKPSTKRKIGTGIDFDPFSGITKWLKGLTTPRKKVDLKAQLKKQQEEKGFRKKAGEKEILGKFRRDLKAEKEAGGGQGRESKLMVKASKKATREYLARTGQEKLRQQQSDDSLAKGIAEKALRASKLRYGLQKGKSKTAVRIGKRDDLLATDKTKKLINQHGPEFAKKIKAHMTDLEPLVHSEMRGEKEWTPKREMRLKGVEKGKALKDLDKFILEKQVKDAGKVPRQYEEGDTGRRLKTLSGPRGHAQYFEVDKKLKKEAPDEAAISKADPKARAFLMKQGRFKSLEDMPKGLSKKEQKGFRQQFFEKKASDRAKRSDVEAKQYEKKKGFFSKLGDRLSTGEWFGSSKDILAAKRREKDKEQAKRERSGEDFEKKKAAQDDKIAMAKEMAAERKKGIEAKGIRETKSIMKRPKPPVVAPKPKVEAPEVKPKKGDMTSKDWAKMGVAGGISLLGGIAAAKQAKADRKRSRAAELRKAKGEAGKSLSQFGSSVMGMDTRLKGGGKVSFKDVLKAKKKMGY